MYLFIVLILILLCLGLFNGEHPDDQETEGGWTVGVIILAIIWFILVGT